MWQNVKLYISVARIAYFHSKEILCEYTRFSVPNSELIHCPTAYIQNRLSQNVHNLHANFAPRRGGERVIWGQSTDHLQSDGHLSGVRWPSEWRRMAICAQHRWPSVHRWMAIRLKGKRHFSAHRSHFFARRWCKMREMNGRKSGAFLHIYVQNGRLFV